MRANQRAACSGGNRAVEDDMDVPHPVRGIATCVSILFTVWIYTNMVRALPMGKSLVPR